MSDEPNGAAESSSSPEAAAETSSNGAGESPKAVIDRLAAAQREQAAGAAQAQQAAAALQEDVNRLQAAYDQVEKAVEAYAKGRWTLEQQADERQRYIAEKRKLIEQAVGDKAGAVDSEWTKVDDEVDELEQKQGELWDKLVKAKAAQQATERARDEAQERLDAVKGRQAKSGERLKKLNDLQSGIESAEDASDPIGMYVRLKEYDQELEALAAGLKDADGYRAEIEAAWRDLDAAQVDVREAAKETAGIQSQHDTTTAQLDQLQNKRVEEIQKRVPAAAAP